MIYPARLFRTRGASPVTNTHIALLNRSLDTETHTPLKPEFP